MLQELAQALTDELNATEWTVSFKAVRRTRPRWSAEDLGTLRVSVADRLKQSTARTRGAKRNQITLEVNFQRHLEISEARTEQELIDTLTGLLEEVSDHFPIPCRLDAYPTLVLTEIGLANNQPASLKAIDEADVFNSSLVFVFDTE